MGKNWTMMDQAMFESDVRDSILAEVTYFNSKPNYDDMEEVDFDEFCSTFYAEF